MQYINEWPWLCSTKTLFKVGAHAYDPGYSEADNQEDYGLKPTPGNSSRDPISKNPSQTRAQGVSPEFKPQYHKNK
jgi:hypothetical protein